MAEHSFRLALTLGSERAPDGAGLCLWVDSLAVDISYSTVTVFIAGGYTESGCPYLLTLKHENEHVDSHRRRHAEHKAALEESLGRAGLPTREEPLLAASREEGESRVRQLVDAAVAPRREEFKRALAEDGALLDSAESYRAYQADCEAWQTGL